MIQRGFTVVEIIITITIMGILLLLAVVNLNGAQMSARDSERVADIETIKTNLESYYATGASSLNESIPTVTNLVTNPSFEVNTTGWVQSCGATSITRDTSRKYSGAASVRVNTSGIDQCMYLSPHISSGAGRTYTVSAWVQGTGTAQLTLGMQPGGVVIGSSAVVALSSTWQRLMVTGITGSGATDAYPVLWQRSSGSNTLYVDGIMATEGPTLYDFASGATKDWLWSSTAQNSTSTGPAIIRDRPGTYPSISLTSSPLINAYLPDADPKAFTAPGQTDPYATFIPATNASQSTSLVTPQPTINQFVYQPIDSSGSLCYTNDCRKYNLYYRLEKDNTVYKATSKVQ